MCFEKISKFLKFNKKKFKVELAGTNYHTNIYNI